MFSRFFVKSMSSLVIKRSAVQVTHPFLKQRTYAALTHNLSEKPAQSKDTFWILGSAAVFLPTLAYLFTPGGSKHSSTSHANPVPDNWARSFKAEDLKAETFNRPIISEDDGKVPAGEGRPHGPGDKAIRLLTKPTETHAGFQASMGGASQNTHAIPEKMEEARAHSAQRNSQETTIDTKAVSAHAHTKHEDKHAQSAA
ncbi:hypothetical protein O181_007704 [Austropuccinia psidii MF-1]|uniref:Uncharacterized protein n=1 Tax=Austropuccinia psidii MF-1 TaxID=1389203 RepID=A0A9Q3BMH7_9BASI|nr:hypothetical protein [Austropuccinia psidii MF-1]